MNVPTESMAEYYRKQYSDLRNLSERELRGGYFTPGGRVECCRVSSASPASVVVLCMQDDEHLGRVFGAMAFGAPVSGT